MPTAEKDWLEMIGEALRDLAILALLFVPLDSLVAQRPYSVSDFVYTASASVALFIFGGILENYVDGDSVTRHPFVKEC